MNKRIYVYTIPVLCLYACQAVQPLRVQHTYYPLYQQLPSDSLLTNLLNNYRQKLRDTLNTVVAFSYQNWFNKPPEYALGNLLADAMINSSPTSETFSAEVAFVHEKKMRGYWPKGNIRLEQFFRLLQADEFWWIYEVRGKELLPTIEKLSAKGGWAVSRGTYIVISKGKLVSISIQGKPLELERVYRIAVLEDNSQAGLFASEVREGSWMSTLLVRDAMVQYCRQITRLGKPLSIHTDKRMYALD
jgi:2',3'-cyclic-nucleotide 2'-phosphodiesterase (5'-nucleotidase family)